MNYFYFSIRTIIIFFILMFIIRILGKREVGELSVFDLVIFLIIADIGAIGIDREELFLISILCLLILVVLQKLFAKLLLKFSNFRDIVDGTPRILIKNGEIIYRNLKKENYTIDDLYTQIRNEGIMRIDEVRLAILETSGKLSVFSKKRYDKIVLPVIISGRIDKEMIRELNLKKEALLRLIKDRNLNLKEILYAESDGEKLLDFKLID